MTYMATTKKDDSLLNLLKSRLTLADRFHKKWRGDVKKWIKDYNIQTIGDAEISSLTNKIHIPYIFSTIESGIPTMFEQVPSVIMTARGREDKEFTDWTNQVWDYVKTRLKLEEKIEDVGYLFKVSGHGGLKYGWITETETVTEEREVPIANEDGTPVESQTIMEKTEVLTRDEPYVETYDYDKLYYSPESKFVIDDDENRIPYILCEHVRTEDEVKELYGRRPSKTEAMDLSSIDKELNERHEGLVNEEDIKRVKLYDYYGTLPKKESKDENWKSSKVYYVVFTNEEIIREPEHFRKKPIIQVKNYGLPTEFHGFGDPKVLRELEQDISLGRARQMDYRDKFGTKIIIPQGTEVDEVALKNPADRTILRMTGQTPPSYMAPPPYPETIIAGIELSKQDLQMASAQLDLSRGSTQSVVDTATGQKIFQEATEKRIGRQRKKMGRLIRAIAKNVLVLCAENWDVERFAKITDTPIEEIEQNQYIEKMKSLGDEYDVDVEVESVTMNRETESAQAIAFYRETKEDPLANHEEILMEVIKKGFRIKNVERFLSGQVTPEQAIKTLEYMVQVNAIDVKTAERLTMALANAVNQEQGGEEGQGQVGRPPSADAADIVKKAAPGADATQISAQNQASYKQTGVAKGPQGI